MKKIALLLISFLIINGLDSQTVSIDHYAATAPAYVTVSIDFSNINNLGALTLFIEYDGTALSYDTMLNVNSLVNGLLVNDIPAQEKVGLAWSATSSGVNINSGLCELRFYFNATGSALHFGSSCELANFGANVMNVSFEDGSISESFVLSISNLNADYCSSTSGFILSGNPTGGSFSINGLQNSYFDPMNLPLGSNTVIYYYTNSFGYSDTLTQNVEIHPDFSYTSNSTDLACFGDSSGTIQLNVSGGTPPYSYSWSNGESTALMNNLAAGTYYFTITDAFCTQNSEITLSQPAELTLGFVTSPATNLASSDGSALVNISGGTPPYNLLWENGVTVQNLSNLAGEFYSLTVSDNNLCERIDSAYVRSFASQSINLPAQWSLFSLNIEPLQANFDSLMQLLSGLVSIAKDENGQVYWPAFTINAIGDYTNTEGYQIKMTSAGVLSVNGYYLNPVYYPVSLPSGWSIFGYIRTTPYSVTSIFSGITSEVALVKDGNGLVYWPQYGLNQIGNLNPGQGYQIKMNSSQSIVYPAN